MDKLFHSNCFCCMSCHRPLQGMQFYDRDGSPQCEDCYVVRRHTDTYWCLSFIILTFIILTFNSFNKLTVLFCVFLVKSEGHILLHLKVLLHRFIHLMFFLFLLRIPWRCVPDVERRLQTVCWRQWASVSMPTVFAAAPAPVYLRGRLSSPMTTTTPTVSRITTGDYWLFMPHWFTWQNRGGRIWPKL